MEINLLKYKRSSKANKTEWEVGIAMMVNSFDFFFSVLKQNLYYIECRDYIKIVIIK